MKINKAYGYKTKTVIDDHFVVVGLTPRDCCKSLRHLVAKSGRDIKAAWYGRVKRRGTYEVLCRADLFVQYT